ncbi:MAG: tetratricopeptide repeat protein, partial [Acidobacteriaceae bacterium]|nr:tetratricopeptide repeat protein [Acidobacteriaceae bacterium]
AFAPTEFAPRLEDLHELNEEQFSARFRNSPVRRAKFAGLLRNVKTVLKNAAAALTTLVLVSLSLHAADRPEDPQSQDPLTNPGWVAFYNNDFDTALSYFDGQVKAHPNDPGEYNHVAQTILYRQMFRSGALESELVSGNNPFLRRPRMEISAQEKQRFTDCIDQALKLSDAALAKNPRDVSALYTLGVAHGLRSNYLFLVEKAWLDSLHEATAARKANQEILRIDPDFVDARLILGLDQYVVACLPFYLRAIGAVGGFHGDKQAGIAQLELVRARGVRNRSDAEVLLAAIYRRERCPEKAIPLVTALAERFPRNYLFRFEQVQMYSDAGDKQSALRVIAQIESLRSQGAPGYSELPPEKIQYLKGNLLFWYGDLPEALMDLKQVTKKADELDLNTAVLSWLRVGQIYDLQGNHELAIEAYRQTMKTAPRSEAAEEANSYIATPYHRKHAAA